jgi:hypothetical protein
MGEAIELYQRIRQYAMGDTSNTNSTPAPPCRRQGSFQSIGRNTEFSKYLHVRQQP